MAIRNSDKIFKPRNIAVIGMSQQQSSVGLTMMRNLLDAGFEGSVVSANPKYARVFDKQAAIVGASGRRGSGSTRDDPLARLKCGFSPYIAGVAKTMAGSATKPPNSGQFGYVCKVKGTPPNKRH